MPSFVTDVEDIRKRAARKIEDGAVTDSYEGDVEQTISILNEALATEIVCVLRYMHHYFMATGVHGTAVRDEFKEHADAEREHADKIAERIQQLGGKPDFNPASLLQRSASQYAEGKTLADMIKEDLIAERIVIEVYQKMIRHFADHDPTTRVMIEHILQRRRRARQRLVGPAVYRRSPQRRDRGRRSGHSSAGHAPRRAVAPAAWQAAAGSGRCRTHQQPKRRRTESGRESHPQKMQRRELDVPATPRPGGGRTEPQKPSLGGERNEEGVGNMVSRDKTLMESPERGKNVSGTARKGQRIKRTRTGGRRKDS